MPTPKLAPLAGVARLRSSNSFPAGDGGDAGAAAHALRSGISAPRLHDWATAPGPRPRLPPPAQVQAPDIPSIHNTAYSQASADRIRNRRPNVHVYKRNANHSLELLAGSHQLVNVPISRSISYTNMSKNMVFSSCSSNNELFLEKNGVHCKRFADNARKELSVDETLNTHISVNRRLSNIKAAESTKHRFLKFGTLQESNLDHVKSNEPTSPNGLDQMHAPTKVNTFLANSNAVTTPPSIFPFPPAHTSCCKTQLEEREISVCKSVNSSVHKKDKYSTLSGDNTTVSKLKEQNSVKIKDFPQRDEEMVSACDKTISRKSSYSLYHYDNEEVHRIDEDSTSFEKPQSYFSNQLNSLSFDEDALIHAFELQSLEDRMSVSESLGSEYEYTSHSRSKQLVSSLTSSDRNTMELNEEPKFPDLESSAPHIKYSKVSPKTSTFEETLCKETILFSDVSDFPKTSSTVKAVSSVSENLKCKCDRSPADSHQRKINNVLLKFKENKDQFKTICHAYSDPALRIYDYTDSGPLRKVKSAEKEYKLKFPDTQGSILPLISLEKIHPLDSSDHNGSEKTPSSENKVTNGMMCVELEMSSGGILHQESDLSSGQLTYTEADASSKALKVSDQDFSSTSLPYTEADVSSIEFPCTEQDIESSVMYTDADTSNDGLQYNEPDDTSSGWPQIEVDTNSTSKLCNEIDTSSYGLSSNEFDTSSSIFDSSSSGLPYIECESTNRPSFKTLQSCSSRQNVDSLNAESSGIVGEEMSVPESLPQSALSTNETPCKDQLKCFPF